jgi:hypothetical protein
VAIIGNEGIVGVPLLQGGSLAVRAISQVSGRSAVGRVVGPIWSAEYSAAAGAG